MSLNKGGWAMQTENTDPECLPVNAPSAKLKVAFEWVSTMIVALVAVACVFALLFRIITVDGVSMTNTLHHGDSLVLTSLFYTPQRGDIVVINRPDGDPLIKRVIGVGGDHIRIDEITGLVYVNNTLLDEPYVKGGVTPPYEMLAAVTVPEGHLFVMGDNRCDSLDSRSLGTFPLNQVMGEVTWRLSPHPGRI